jgi:hypothetical protein
MTDIGAMWKKTDKNGSPFWSGILKIEGEEIPVLCFRNKQKKTEKHPDIRVYRTDDKPRPQGRFQQSYEQPSYQQESFENTPF